MSIRSRKLFGFTSVVLAMFVLAACSNSDDGGGSGENASGGPCTPADSPVINFAAYSTPREVYGKIIPAFQSLWKDEHDG